MVDEIDLSRADLNLLVLFDVVLQERHVGRAAQRLHLTPSAVSHGLGRLRRLLGDPLFLRTPRGVVPTERAARLAEPIADMLARARRVLANAEPFDPARARRRFAIGAPDGVAAVFMPVLLADLRAEGPGLDLAVRQLLPLAGETSVERAWRGAFDDLDARALDVAVIPSPQAPGRFHVRSLFEESFVVVARPGHPFLADPTLDRFCDALHMVVSATGEAHGFVDDALGSTGRTRRVALTVPSFMLALALVASTDLLCAVPRRFAATHAARLGAASVDAPLPLGSFGVSAIVSKAALLDAGVAWLLDHLADGQSGRPRSTIAG